MPSSSRMSVVLPAPLGPSRAKISPRRTSNDTPATARTVAKAFVTSWTLRMLITLTILHLCDKCGVGLVGACDQSPRAVAYRLPPSNRPHRSPGHALAKTVRCRRRHCARRVLRGPCRREAAPALQRPYGLSAQRAATGLGHGRPGGTGHGLDQGRDSPVH